MQEARIRRQYDLMVAEEGLTCLTVTRAKCRRMFQSSAFQISVAVLIVAAFGLDMLEAQLLPEPGSPVEAMFNALDATLTALFTLEVRRPSCVPRDSPRCTLEQRPSLAIRR